MKYGTKNYYFTVSIMFLSGYRLVTLELGCVKGERELDLTDKWNNTLNNLERLNLKWLEEYGERMDNITLNVLGLRIPSKTGDIVSKTGLRKIREFCFHVLWKPTLCAVILWAGVKIHLG